MYYRRHGTLYACFLDQQAQAFCYTPIDFKYRFYTVRALRIFLILKIHIGSREIDLEENTTHICKIIAVYWPKPLKALQTTALLDSPHRVIDSFFSPKSTVAQALFSLLSTRQKHLFIATAPAVIRHHSPVLLLAGKCWCEVLGRDNTLNLEVCLLSAQGLHLWPQQTVESPPHSCFALAQAS